MLEGCESVCVGYSGGVDSVFLSVLAVEVLGRDRVLAVTGLSPSYPAVQRRMAVECVTRFDIPHVEVTTSELEDPAYVANAPDRCYHCKSELWDRLARVARARGLRTVVDGSNVDDAGDHRPGLRAGRERGVRSPLREAGLGKAEIRTLSRELGLPTWDRPASPCLASRLAYGLAVTPARLTQVEEAESLLRRAGLRELRVRHHGHSARVEVAPAELEHATAVFPDLVPRILELGFRRVLLDVEGYRRGALNEGLVRLNGDRLDAAVEGRARQARPGGPAGAPAGAAERDRGREGRVVGVARLLEGAGLSDRAGRSGRPDRHGGTDGAGEGGGARVSEAGADGEIVVVRGREQDRTRLAGLAPQMRALGYRYVALEVGEGTTDDGRS